MGNRLKARQHKILRVEREVDKIFAENFTYSFDSILCYIAAAPVYNSKLTRDTMNKLISMSVIYETLFQSTYMKRDSIDENLLHKLVEEYFYQKKYNGCYTLLIIDDYGTAQVFNKNMAIVPNLTDAIMEARNKLAVGKVYLCEAVVYKQNVENSNLEEFEEASRTFNPNTNTKPDGIAKLVIFDMVSIDEFIKGKSVYGFGLRWEEVEELRDVYSTWQHIEFAETYIISNPSQLDYIYNKCLTRGDEGAIITTTDCIWNRRVNCCDSSWKLIPIPTIDLEILGFKTGKGKYTGIAATLTYCIPSFLKEGNPKTYIEVDGSITYEMRKDIAENFANYKGKISKISYKGFTRYGKLRQPKVLEVARYDKFKSDTE